MTINQLRRQYHQDLCEQIIFLDKSSIPNFADRDSVLSSKIAQKIVSKIGFPCRSTTIKGQTAGTQFEDITAHFIQQAFNLLEHIRPGPWRHSIHDNIENFEQYEHLNQLAGFLQSNRVLRATLGDYLITPDIVISRVPIEDEIINQNNPVVDPDTSIASHTPLRMNNSQKNILHASISCKWTIRSDRSQNARTEGLNLVRNRKGNTPHIAIVTAEPSPQRLASIALGTGDIDCVYHFALNELQSALSELPYPDAQEMLDILVSGKRLRDISDLPFDLAI